MHAAPCLSPPVFTGCLLLSAPVFGYLGDRHSRKATLSFGILLWSGAGFSSSFISPRVGALTSTQAPGNLAPPPSSLNQSHQSWVGCFCSIPGSRHAGDFLPGPREDPLGFLNPSLRPLHLPLLPVVSFLQPVLRVGMGVGKQPLSRGAGLVSQGDAQEEGSLGLGAGSRHRGHLCDLGNPGWEDSKVPVAGSPLPLLGARVSKCPCPSDKSLSPLPLVDFWNSLCSCVCLPSIPGSSSCPGEWWALAPPATPPSRPLSWETSL